MHRSQADLYGLLASPLPPFVVRAASDSAGRLNAGGREKRTSSNDKRSSPPRVLKYLSGMTRGLELDRELQASQLSGVGTLSA